MNGAWQGLDDPAHDLSQQGDVFSVCYGKGDSITLWSILHCGECTYPHTARYTAASYDRCWGKESAQLAGRIGDGLISTSPDAELIEIFSANRHKDQPRFGQITVCCGEDEKQARKIAHEYWPTAAPHGTLNQELPTPQHFGQAAKTSSIICGNKVQRHLDAIQEYVDVGFDHIYIHQVGPNQEEFFRFYSQHIIPALKEFVSR